MKWCTYSILFCLLLHVAHCDDDPDDDTTIEIEEDQQDDVIYVSPDPPPGAYFAEHFDDSKKFSKKWIKSQAKKEDTDDDIAKYDGLWQLEAAERDALAGDLGLVLKSKAKHAAISAKLDRLFQFDTKPLVVQYEVNLQNGQDCGGSYLKLLADSPMLDLKTFRDKTPYIVMFGPDKCGNDYKLHFIFQHKNPKNGTMSEKHAKRPNQRVEEPFKDKKPHLYRLVVYPDNSYEISVDNQVMNSGSLLEDFTPPVNPPEEIDDPSDYKPEDWDEREKIPDPEAVKPADWDEDAPPKISDPSATKPEGWLDDEPQMIGDPDAQKPEDWDDEMDGDWEAPLIDNPKCSEAPGCGKWSAPMIDNPNFKGKWRAPLINNPTYKGKWKPNRIPNPDYFHDDQPFKMGSIAAIGFELWSMSDSILFDNVIITDSVAEAQAWAEQTFTLKQRKSDKNAGGMLRRFLRYSNERPWLWAVYVVLIGLPSVLLVAYCCSSTKKDDDEGEAKKTDKVTPDDPIKEEPTKDAELLEQEDEESGDEEEKVGEPEDGDEPEELEEEVDETPDDSEKVDDAVEVLDETGDAPKSPRRRRTRKD